MRTEQISRIIDRHLRDAQVLPGDLIWTRPGGPSVLSRNLAEAIEAVLVGDGWNPTPNLRELDASMERLLKAFPSDVELPDEVAGPISAAGAGQVRQLIYDNAKLRKWLEWYQAMLSASPLVYSREGAYSTDIAAGSPSGDAASAPPRKSEETPLGPVNCTHVLRRDGKPYPRTCERCHLGPCPFYRIDGRPASPLGEG